MNAIIGYADLASRHLKETEKLGRYLEKIQICGGQLLSLLSNILDLARIENNKIEMEYDVSNVHENFENCVAMFQQLAESKNQTLSDGTDYVSVCIYGCTAPVRSLFQYYK